MIFRNWTFNDYCTIEFCPICNRLTLTSTANSKRCENQKCKAFFLTLSEVKKARIAKQPKTDQLPMFAAVGPGRLSAWVMG